MTQFSHISLHFTILLLIFADNCIFRLATATITTNSRDQVACNMCDECDNPCQQPSPSPPPPSPSPPPPSSADTNCPPPPSPPSSGANPPPSVPTFPYYSPPPPATGGGGYGYPTPPPPNPILPYFPFYYYNPPPARPDSFSVRLNINPNQIILPLSFLLFCFF